MSCCVETARGARSLPSGTANDSHGAICSWFQQRTCSGEQREKAFLLDDLEVRRSEMPKGIKLQWQWPCHTFFRFKSARIALQASDLRNISIPPYFMLREKEWMTFQGFFLSCKDHVGHIPMDFSVQCVCKRGPSKFHRCAHL